MPNSPILYQDPKIKYPIYDLDLPFSDYIAECRNLIKQTRQDLAESPDPQKIIDANTPFVLKPKNNKKSRYGALLIHGLLDSPFVMRDIGNQLQQQDILVHSVLLPGHGTVPGALLSVQYEDWLQTMYYGIRSLEKEVDKIFLVGFSTGAALSLYHMLTQKADSVIGLILLAPAMKINSRFDFVTNWHQIISWAWGRARWMAQAEENDYAKYQSFPFNAPYQVYRLSKAIKKLNGSHKLNTPALIAISEADQTVSSKVTIDYFRRYTNENCRMIIYSNHNTYKNDNRIIVRTATYPKWKIQDISHIAIPIELNNPHYGINGDYPLASHVEANLSAKDPVVYGAYSKPLSDIYKLLHRWGWKDERYERLTFNPDFEFLSEELIKFIT